MADREYDLIGRLMYATSKLGADALQQIPYVGPPVARQMDKICAKIDWAGDYVAQRSDNTRGAMCDAIQDSVTEEQLGQLSPPSAPAGASVPHRAEVPHR